MKFTPLFSLCFATGFLAMSQMAVAEEFHLKLRSQKPLESADQKFERFTVNQSWRPEETAVIVCDVWDKHHCLNAVRRMEEFVPTINDVLTKARKQGATIIHSPSDCMPAYENHPARARAERAPVAANKPKDVEFWCSNIPAEEQASYPIDQSDGGEDDDPTEHARWAAELKQLGRNPGLPWKTQSNLISIDEDSDYISDRGDEVWNILESRGIKNVILVGVHTNMCVLGRPFGLRQMARNGKNVVLMRDMTDCMYNPGRWPYVDHFTGNDLIVSHVERFVCPTITSDQILGGQPFASKYDTRKQRDLMNIESAASASDSFKKQWTTAVAEDSWQEASGGRFTEVTGVVWYRCSLRLPSTWINDSRLLLNVKQAAENETRAWINGSELKAGVDNRSLMVPRDVITPDDIDLLVVRVEHKLASPRLLTPPVLQAAGQSLTLDGRWQFRIGDDASWTNIPLPAKFGMGSDVLHEPR